MVKADDKYLRPGHVNLERKSDELSLYAVELLPGDSVLPQRWSYRNRGYFRKKYGKEGPVVWARTGSYNLCFMQNVHVFRIWHDAPVTCLVDVTEEMAKMLESKYNFEVMSIPKSTYKKTKPFKKRIRIQTKADVRKLLLVAINCHMWDIDA